MAGGHCNEGEGARKIKKIKKINRIRLMVVIESNKTIYMQ